MEPDLVQILVVVAIIQMRTLKAEVEKGSMSTAIGHGLVDPEKRGKPVLTNMVGLVLSLDDDSRIK